MNFNKTWQLYLSFTNRNFTNEGDGDISISYTKQMNHLCSIPRTCVHDVYIHLAFTANCGFYDRLLYRSCPDRTCYEMLQVYNLFQCFPDVHIIDAAVIHSR